MDLIKLQLLFIYPMRPSFPYRKKQSQNTEYTSFYSEKTQNKVLSVQKNPSRKLSEYIHPHSETQIRSKSIPLIQILTNNIGSAPHERTPRDDPFINAQLRCMADHTNKQILPKKVGRLYDELNMQSFEENSMTTLKREQEKEKRNQDVSIRSIINHRNKKM